MKRSTVSIRFNKHLYAVAIVVAVLAVAMPAVAQTATPLIVPMSDTERLDTVVPKLMRDNKVSMWILMAREYFEEPVVATMLNAESMHARRRTILIFNNPGNGQPVERLTVSRYGLGELFKSAWDPDKQPDQWKAVADIVEARHPATIAINTSSMFAFADGMTQSQYTDLMAALPQKYHARVISAEPLAIGWLETRTPTELRL